MKNLAGNDGGVELLVVERCILPFIATFLIQAEMTRWMGWRWPSAPRLRGNGFMVESQQRSIAERPGKGNDGLVKRPWRLFSLSSRP
jgi:hypothetical protein